MSKHRNNKRQRINRKRIVLRGKPVPVAATRRVRVAAENAGKAARRAATGRGTEALAEIADGVKGVEMTGGVVETVRDSTARLKSIWKN